MLPAKTKDTNHTFVLPGGTEENNLPVEATTDADGAPCLVSTWVLTDLEREWIANGAHVRLVVWGGGHPPVALSLEKEGNILLASGEVDSGPE